MARTRERFSIHASVEQVLLATALFWALAANRLFVVGALENRLWTEPRDWGFALALVVLLTALHYLLLALLANRWTAKPLLALLIVATACATYFMQAFGVYLDPSMLRNVLRTDVAEARELFSWGLALHLLAYGVLPLVLLWRVRFVHRPWLRATLVRLGSIALAAALFVATLVAVFQPLASLMRNHKEMRYLITPGNYLWSAGTVIAEQTRGAAQPRQAIGLDERLAAARGTQFLVLHMLGNHGPSYFRRYPPAFERFKPACTKDDLQLCSREEVVNAYDNALLYTDHVLARVIAKLQGAAARVDSALLFVSDHGESLGENNLYLHGMPYAIAPDVQTRVPMVMWLSSGLPADAGLDPDCLRRRAAQPATHDNLFHTILGLLDVKTALYDPAWDLAQACRKAAAP